MVRADLHNHLRTSSMCSSEDLNRAVDIAYKRLQPSGIFSVTNFADNRYENLVNSKGYDRIYLGENKNATYFPDFDICLVKGEEVPTKQGHILALGVEMNVHFKRDRCIEDTIKSIKDCEGIVIVTHPFNVFGAGPYLKKNLDLINEVDGVEVHNGESILNLSFNPISPNFRARLFYNDSLKLNPCLGAISSSDGHSFRELCTSWTELEQIDYCDFIKSLRDSIKNTNFATKSRKVNSIYDSFNHFLHLKIYKS